MFEKIIGIFVLMIIIIVAYMFLFWIIKQLSSVFVEYENEDKKGKRGIIMGFLLVSSFIIVPGYIIFNCICKLIEMFI